MGSVQISQKMISESGRSTLSKKRYESGNLRAWIESGIMHGEYLKPIISIEIAKEMVDTRHKLSEGKPISIVIDISRTKSVSKEARDYLASEEGSINLIACALITKSRIQNLLANTFVLLNTPKVPIKFFRYKTYALDWLKNQKQN